MTTEHSQTSTDKPVSLPSNPPQNLSVANADDAAQERKLAPLPYSPTENKTQWAFACETHKYVREFINNADNKAQHYIAFASAFLVWLSTRENTKFWDIPTKEWRLLEMLNFVSIVGMATCILFALFALLPRLKGSKKGIIFFDSIAEHEISNDYLSDVLKKSEQELVIEELRHIYELSGICSKKFFWLKISVWCGSVGLLTGISLILIN